MNEKISERLAALRKSVNAWRNEVRTRWRAKTQLDKVATAGSAVLLLLIICVGAVLAASAGVTPCGEDVCIEVIGPKGDAVQPMTPVQIRITGDINQQDAISALKITHDPAGSRDFEGDVLTFRPQWPGFARGIKYDVALDLPAATTPAGFVSFNFTTDGKLKVAAAFPPDGSQEVALDGAIMLQFSRSVAPLTVVTASGPQDILAINPPVEGTGKWLNTSLYTFTPAAPGWAPATDYAVTVKAGLTNDLGGQLEADYPFSFTTVSPGVAAVTPTDNSNFVAPLPDITVQYNQPVDHATAEASFSLTPNGGGPVAGSFRWTDDATLVFTPAATLPLDTPFTALVSPGTKALNGEAAMPGEKRWLFTTIGEPRIVSTTPANGDQHAFGGGFQIIFSNPMDVASVEDNLTVIPTPEDPPNVSLGPDGLSAYVSYATQPSSPYRVLLTSAATDRYGQHLTGGLDLNYVTDRIPPGFYLFRSSRAGTYNAYLDPKLMVSSTNVTQLDYQLYTVEPQNLIDSETKYPPFSPNPDRLVRTWTETPQAPLDKSVITTSRLAAQSDSLAEGVYYVRVTSPSVPTYGDVGMFFVVSSVNVVTKWTQHDVLIWMVDLQTGQPIADQDFQLLNKDGGTARSAKTDAQGIARVDIAVGPDYYANPLYVWLQSGGRTVLSGTNWDDGISSWNYQSGANFQFAPPSLAGYVYTDRPIYRPGETAYFKGVIRADDDANYSLPSVDTVYFSVRDEQGRLVDNRAVPLSEAGTFDSSLDLSPEASTGLYNGQLSLTAASDTNYAAPIAFVSFRVAEFRKPEFEVNVTTENESYANGETINATVAAGLFFGAPLTNAGVAWRVTSQPYFFRPDGYPGYNFGDVESRYLFDFSQDFESQEFLRAEGTGTTDADGRFPFNLPADISRDATSQVFTLEVTVTDQNGQAVGAFVGVPVHKGDFYIGMNPRDYVAIAGSETTIDLVSLDPEENPVPSVPVEISAYLRRWNTVLDVDAEGEQRYRSEPDDTLVQTINASTGADGKGAFNFTPPGSGTYYLVARATDSVGNQVKSSAYIWASSSEYASWFVGNDDLIQLVADKETYSPGDTARILVAAPFADSHGLVTFERGRIRGYELRDFATNSDILEVPITSDHIPNIFVGVTLFKPPTADNPMPQAKFGLVELKVSTDEKELQISITPDHDRLNPRDTVTYEITTTDSAGRRIPAELSLALVDLSVLSLQDDLARDPVEAFWSAHPLGVATASTFAVSIDRTNQLAINRQQGVGGKGGGGGAGDQSRTFFPNTAYWEPALQTDSNGHATVKVILPDTLTTWRMTARGVTGDTRVGDAQNDIVTAKDVIIRPAVPRFFLAGDHASLGAIVHNFTPDAQNIDVSLQAEGINLDGAPTQTVTIPAGQETLVRWETTVPYSAADSVTLTFNAQAGVGSDSVSLDLPLYAFWTPETTGTAGETTGEAAEAVEVPYYVRPDAGELTVRLSPSLACGVNTSLDYLLEYPYESAETTVSRFLPRLALNRAVKELGLTDLPGGEVDSLVERSVQRLYSNQHADGGWGWWIDGDSDPAITAYALIGLAEASEAGYTVDGAVKENAATYLLGELNKPRDVESPEFNLRAYLVYALAQSGHGELGRSFALAEERANLSNAAKAWVALAIKALGGSLTDPRLTSLMADLQAAAIPSATGNHWEETQYDQNVFGNSVQTTAQVLQAFTALQPDNPLLDGTLRWLMVARKEGHWDSTQGTAVAILAITDFMRVRKDAQESFAYHVDLNGERQLEGTAEKGKVQQEDTVVIPISDLLNGTLNKLDVARTPAGDSRLYYTAHLRYFTPAEDIEAASYGIGVSHEYFAADSDTPISEVGLGDTVRVKVTLVAPADLNFLVLEDYLPSGLEPIDTSLKTTPLEFRHQLSTDQRKAYQVSKRWSPFDHTDIRDNRVALFARFVAKGVYEYTYFARATTPGSFHVPPATASEQYFPEVWGRSDSSTFTVGS